MTAGPTRGALRVGTRGSALARRQAAIVIDALLETDRDLECELRVIRTEGDSRCAAARYRLPNGPQLPLAEKLVVAAARIR